MPDEALYTLRHIADVLQLPESTVRYYRDAFLDHVPATGTGRRRRYPAAAVAVLRSVAAGYAAGHSRAEVMASSRGEGSASQAVALSADQSTRSVPIDEVSNLDLLAAIVDGERQQRDALWQMAREDVRLTEVLEGQDSVLSQIADRAGVIVANTPRLAHDAPAAAAIASAATPAPSVSPLASEVLDQLRADLEAERALVERLRESKLQLEHRAAEAESALEDRGTRRPSVISRLLGNEPEP